MPTPDTDLFALRIRSLIADKEMVVATANRDLAKGGEWLCDYTAWIAEIDLQIEALFLQANADNI